MPKPSSKRQRVGSSRASPATRSRSTSASKSTDVCNNGDATQQLRVPRVRKTSTTDGAIRVTVMIADSAAKELDDAALEPWDAQMAEPTVASELACDTTDKQASESDTHASVKRRRTSASVESDAQAMSDTADATTEAPVTAMDATSVLLNGVDAREDGDGVATAPALDNVTSTAAAVSSNGERAVKQEGQRSDEPVDTAPRSPDAPAAAAKEDEIESLIQLEQDGDSAVASVGSDVEPRVMSEQDGGDAEEPVDRSADVEMRSQDERSAVDALDASDDAEAIETADLAQEHEASVETELVRVELKEPDGAKRDAVTSADDKENDCNSTQSLLESAHAVESLLRKACDGSAINDNKSAPGKPEQQHTDVPPCVEPLPDKPTEPTTNQPQQLPQSRLPATRKSKTAAKKRSAASSVSLTSTRHLFQFTCKLLQSQRLEFEVRAREVEEKRAALAMTREKWEKRIRSVKRQLRDFGHPVDDVEAAPDGPAPGCSTTVNGASSRAFASPSVATSASDPLALARSGDWSGALAAPDAGSSSATSSLITMRDAFSTRQHSGASHGATGAASGSNGVDSHFPAGIQTLETQIRDALASRKRMVHDMLRDLDGGRRPPSDVVAAAARSR